MTQYCPLHPTAQAYPAWSIHFMTAPPCTLPPKFTSVGSAKNRSVISRSLSGMAVAFYRATPDRARALTAETLGLGDPLRAALREGPYPAPGRQRRSITVNDHFWVTSASDESSANTFTVCLPGESLLLSWTSLSVAWE